MPNARHAYVVLSIFALFVLTGGCSLTTIENQETQSPSSARNAIDSSCAYFYFLRGSQAEYG